MAAPVVGQEQTEHANFTHLVYDIAWFGLALAATSRFLSVYAIRLGATPVDLGWISALPALVLMISATFGKSWLARFQSVRNALMLPSLGFRLLFLLPVFAPLLPSQWQPLWLILSVTLPALPQGIAGVAFLILMRDSVFEDHIPSLLGRRSLALNIAIGIGALGFGFLLEQIVFPTNYQLMFLTAFAFALVSMYHVLSLKIVIEPKVILQEATQSVRSAWRNTNFRSVAFITMVIHLAFFAIVPVTPLYLVNRMGADEGFMAIFGMVELSAGALVSVLAPRLVERIGSRSVIALAMIGTAAAAVCIVIAPNLPITLLGAALSGGSWTAAASVGLMTHFMQRTPSDEMPVYSTAFHQSIGLAVFIGPMIGSLLANSGVDLLLVLTLGAVLRLVAGLIIGGRSFHLPLRRGNSEAVLPQPM